VKLNSAKLGPDKPAVGFNRKCADTVLIHGATTNKMSIRSAIKTSVTSSWHFISTYFHVKMSFIKT